MRSIESVRADNSLAWAGDRLALLDEDYVVVDEAHASPRSKSVMLHQFSSSLPPLQLNEQPMAVRENNKIASFI
jgi:hypothetical protein